MDWQIKFALLAFLTLLHGIVHAQSAKTCGKAWVSAGAEASIQNGKLLELVKGEKDKPDKVRVKDFRGNFVREVSLPRKANFLNAMDSAGDTFVYQSQGKYYHFDPEKNREQEIFMKSKDSALCDSGTKTSLVASCGSSSDNFVYDFKSQKQFDLPKGARPDIKGQRVVYEDKDSSGATSKISVYDFASSKKVSIEVPRANYVRFISENDIHIQHNNEGKSTRLIFLEGRWLKFTDAKNRRLSGILSDGDLVFVNTKNKKGKDEAISNQNYNDFEVTTEIYDKTGAQKKKTIRGFYMQDPFSGGKAFTKVEVSSDSTVKMEAYSEEAFQKIANGKDTKPKIVSDTFIRTSESGKWGLDLNFKKKEARLVELKTGQSFALPYMTNAEIREAEVGGKVVVTSPDRQTYIVDPKSGKIRSFEAGGYRQFDKKIDDWFEMKNGYETVREVCFPDNIKVIEDDCGCLFRNADNAVFTQEQNIKNAKDLVLATMCQSEEFNVKEWDKIAPPITKGEISKAQAQIYLKRFQKKQGFDPKIHLGILSGILKSDLIEKSPALVNEALKSIASADPTIIRQIYNVLKIDKRMPDYKSDESQTCRSTSENKNIEYTIKKFKEKASDTDGRTTVEDWIAYRPFAADLQKLPKEEKEAIVDSIAESLSQNAAASTDLSGVFQSKLYYFSKKFALDLVGEKSKSATDLAIAVRNGQSVPIVLGSGDLQESTVFAHENTVNAESRYGFKYKTFDPLAVKKDGQVGDVTTKKIDWKHDGQSYSAEAKTTILEPLKNLIAPDKSPNYAALKKDGKLTGMMVIGTNLSASQAGLVDQYLTYYQNAGYKFKAAKPVDAVSFFKTSIQSGELDYLIKEAHSDGDEKNLFRANKHGKVFEGTLTKKDGTQEVVYLLTPEEGKKESKLISNHEFGSWVRSRSKDQPMVYFNASCTSVRKVISEISATHSANFTPIPSDSTVRTFRDTEDNGTRQMLQAFREGKNYDGIREALQKSANYKKGEDRFLFPDEKSYDDRVRKNLEMSFDVEVSVKDKAGNEVHLDENIEH